MAVPPVAVRLLQDQQRVLWAQGFRSGGGLPWANLGFGRIVALYYRSSTLKYHIH